MKIKNIRNFSIIAHINHGKSTLSDRIIEICNKIPFKGITPQILDSMDLEKEKGITIKSRSVNLNYKNSNKKKYFLNLIDTPGHVDFSYEVSRSLSACEGALLIIDAKQGIESQTIAHFNAAYKMKIKIIPVLNKIDLPNIDINKIIKKIKNTFKINNHYPLLCSAKTGKGIKNLIETIISDIPYPNGNQKNPLQALIIDSWFDNYLGVVSLICIKNGYIYKGKKIKIISTKKNYYVNKLGKFTPKQIECKQLNCGEVGWIICGIKNINYAPVGDTLTSYENPILNKLKGFKKTKPQIYSSFFPANQKDYKLFCKSLEKLKLNDASFFYEQQNSSTIGFGFKCGFLGTLHMEIIKERLKREYNLELIITSPTVIHEIELKNGKILNIDNPTKLPKINNIKEIRTPIAKCIISTPEKYVGKIISICTKKNGIQINIIYTKNQVTIIYEIPLIKVISNFSDQIKSISQGYASLNYYFIHFKKEDIVCIDVYINKMKIKDLSSFVSRIDAIHFSKNIINKIKKLIPKQLFEITIQTAINKKIIISSKIKSLRKNVTDKCYGGDISRKKKLLQKQKQGKKKMAQIGKFTIQKKVLAKILNSNIKR